MKSIIPIITIATILVLTGCDNKVTETGNRIVENANHINTVVAENLQGVLDDLKNNKIIEKKIQFVRHAVYTGGACNGHRVSKVLDQMFVKTSWDGMVLDDENILIKASGVMKIDPDMKVRMVFLAHQNDDQLGLKRPVDLQNVEINTPEQTNIGAVMVLICSGVEL